MKKTLQIISSTYAREINPLGDKPIEDLSTPDKAYLNYGINHKNYLGKLNQWQQAESSLKEYRIDLESTAPIDKELRHNCTWECSRCLNNNYIYSFECEYCKLPFIPIGSIHECEVDETNLTAVIL